MNSFDFPNNLIATILSGKNLEEIKLPSDILGTFYYVMYETLSSREVDILLMRYSAEESYRAIGEKYNVTRERIRQEEAKALKKLQASKIIELLLNGIEKTRSSDYEDGYNEGIKAAKREIVDTLSEQLYGSRDNIPIEDMKLSVRTFNTLKRVGIKTLSDILREKKEGLKKVEHLGRNGYNEVVEILVTRYGQERSDWTFWTLDEEGK